MNTNAIMHVQNDTCTAPPPTKADVILLVTSRKFSVAQKIDLALRHTKYFTDLSQPADIMFYQTTWWLIKQAGSIEHKRKFIQAVNNANQIPAFIQS